MALDRQERAGILYGILASVLWSFFPVLVHQGAQQLPPLTFIGIATLIGATVSFLFSAARGHLGELKNRNAYGSLFMITLFIIVIPWALISIGSQFTSGANTSILLLTEVIYTVLFTHFIGERISISKIIAAIGVFVGAVLVIYNGAFEVNTGDLLIALAPMCYPIGNLYSKRALNFVSSSTITWTRFFLGGFFLLGLSFLFEPDADFLEIFTDYWQLIVVIGIFVIGIRTIIAYESLKRLDISKFIFIAMSFPLFSLFTLILVYDEPISIYQWVGTFIMLFSIYFVSIKPSTDPRKTKYAPLQK